MAPTKAHAPRAQPRPTRPGLAPGHGPISNALPLLQPCPPGDSQIWVTRSVTPPPGSSPTPSHLPACPSIAGHHELPWAGARPCSGYHRTRERRPRPTPWPKGGCAPLEVPSPSLVPALASSARAPWTESVVEGQEGQSLQSPLRSLGLLFRSPVTQPASEPQLGAPSSRQS